MTEHTRDILTYDVAIIGGGPAGLSAALRLKQLDTEGALTVCVIEKSAEIGGHSLAGAVLDPRSLDELLPDWQQDADFIHQPATTDQFMLLTRQRAVTLPTPPQMHNKGNYIISLSQLNRYLARKAEALGVDVLPGFAAQSALVEDGRVMGVRTGDFGRTKDGAEGPGFALGPDVHARVTLFAEGCRGHITKSLVEPFGLAEDRCPQTYAQGVKEIWRVAPEQHKPGHIVHTIGWPLNSKTYGGGWIYHLPDNKVSIGFVVGLDYADTALSPTNLLQAYKEHPALKELLDGGELLAAGARSLYEGGLQSQYKLAIPGALFMGDAAGFLNVPRIKGIHTAMKSGMLAAEAAAAHLRNETPLADFAKRVQECWLGSELHKVRNIRPGFARGLWLGLANAALETLLKGKTPWTLKHRRADHQALTRTSAATAPADVPADVLADVLAPAPAFDASSPLTIDRLTGVSLTNTAHNEDQPVHLQILDPDVCVSRCTAEYGNPCTRFCPAGVYEMLGVEEGQPKLQINAANCIHCKTCDIKDPYQIINWVTPEGGSGPNYSEM